MTIRQALAQSRNIPARPGSTFKPFVYATLFKKGYTPETVLYDYPMEFSQYCNPDGKPKNDTDDPTKVCYSPQEFDKIYTGPMTIRQALAQSRNIPAVQALYLSGMRDSLRTADDLGITTLDDPNRYGLTLVLGGGEVMQRIKKISIVMRLFNFFFVKPLKEDGANSKKKYCFSKISSRKKWLGNE
jgi:membrane carboxypeptidase/penicillin-binding protein PbpC